LTNKDWGHCALDSPLSDPSIRVEPASKRLTVIKPQVIEHNGVSVVRDDLFPGGTKARFIPLLFNGVNEVVYASPAEGGAQTALATVAGQLGKRATIFVARRNKWHDRTLMAKRLGAKIEQVSPGHLNVVQARARKYSYQTGALLAPFGFDIPGATQAIAQAARSIGIQPHEVWCAAGSGVLARGLAQAWPSARRHVVQVGRTLSPNDVAGATIHVYPKPFGWAVKNPPPFPSDPHYDAKAWELCVKHKGPGVVLFWNVTDPA
jgi:hypothetical protein